MWRSAARIAHPGLNSSPRFTDSREHTLRDLAPTQKQMRRSLALLIYVICNLRWLLAADAGAGSYLSRLQEALSRAGTNMPAITQSAEQAAGDFLAGGNLWAAGRQGDFIAAPFSPSAPASSGENT